ncbi:MAG: hypothetical protein WKF47_14415 [Geodermatophilaceae bacterium]
MTRAGRLWTLAIRRVVIGRAEQLRIRLPSERGTGRAAFVALRDIDLQVGLTLALAP